MFHVEHYVVGSGDNHTPPTPSLRLSITLLPPSLFISHSITFSYTISTISITISYILVGCEVVLSVIAHQIRVYINYNTLVLLHVYYIPLPPDRVSIVFY